MPYKPPREGLTKVIKFQSDKNIKEKKSPLISKEILCGTKVAKKTIYQSLKNKQLPQPQLLIIFYDEMYTCPYLESMKQWRNY